VWANPEGGCEMSESLSEKRSRAGRLGAQARWGSRDSDNGNLPSRMASDGKRHMRTTRSVAALRQGRNDWYRIANKSSSVAEVMIYDEIGFFGVTAADFVKDLRGITADQIDLRLNTPGGDVFDGVAIYNALRDHAARVEVTVDGLAASAGSFIAQAGDRVVMNRGSQMMIHDAWGLTIGNADDMRQMADLLDKNTASIAGIYAERSGRPVDEWRDLMRAETWFDADEAVEAGLADEVAGRSAASRNSFDLSVFRYGGRDEAPDPQQQRRAAYDSGSSAARHVSNGSEPDLDFETITQALKEAFA
jgi:ATP-dependent protease ClpP protease subunit